MMPGDLELIQDIPGYGAILKSVLKTQIKLLVDQLYRETGEEAVILTASLKDGSFCTNLGSDFGNNFLECHDMIKSQFYGFCVNRQKLQKKPGATSLKYDLQPAAKRIKTMPIVPVSPSPTMFKMVKSEPPGVQRTSRLASKTTNPDTSTHTRSVVEVVMPPGEESAHPKSPDVTIVGQPNTPLKLTKASHPMTRVAAHTSSQSSVSSEIQAHGVSVSGASGSHVVVNVKGTPSSTAHTYVTMLDEDTGVEETVVLEVQEEQTEQESEEGDSDLDLDQTVTPASTDTMSTFPVTSVNVSPKPALSNQTYGKQPWPRKKRDRKRKLPNTPPIPISKTGTLNARLRQKLEDKKDQCICKICGLLTLRRDRLELHMRSHTLEKPLACVVCGVRFRFAGSLTRHMRLHHSLEQAQASKYK